MKKSLLLLMLAALGTTLVGCGSTEVQPEIQDPLPGDEVQEPLPGDEENAEPSDGQAGDFGTQSADDLLCLQEANVVLYYTKWSNASTSLLEAMGSVADSITTVDCGENEDECKKVGITGYPSFMISGSSYSGLTNMNDILEAAGCL